MVQPEEILEEYYDKESRLYSYLIKHSKAVAEKSLDIAGNINVDIDKQFLQEAALLHDIGIYKTDLPELDCYGARPYICHGILGREILSRIGWEKHGKVCERHIGVGITSKDVEKQNLPLPQRNMEPKTLEEKIITYADLFYSKNGQHLTREKNTEKIKKKLKQIGSDKVAKFNRWSKKFEMNKNNSILSG